MNNLLPTAHIAGPAPDSGAPVAVLLHGFTQNLHCWGRFADHLGQQFSVFAVDLPGHGASDAPSSSFEAAAELVHETLDALPGTIDCLVGYSMGGRMALRVLLDHPASVRRLVLIGATAGIDESDLRQMRIDADAALAARVRDLGPEAFLDFWLGMSLFSALGEDQHFRAERLQHWGNGVAETLLHRGTGNMEPLWHRLNEIQSPVLVIAGEDDRKFTGIGEKLVVGIGANGIQVTIPGSSHACHLHHPHETANAIMEWSPTNGA